MQLYQLDTHTGQSLQGTALADRIQQHGSHWLLTQRTREELTHRHWLRFRNLSIEPHAVDRQRWEGATSRLILGWSAATCGPLPDNVREEALLMLYTRPTLRLEYVGRGLVSEKATSYRDSVIYLDIAGGRRRYAFRPFSSSGQSDERIQAVSNTYARIGQWLDDPSARVVLSLGGGGFRLFAAQAAVRGLERLLGNDRSKIDEVWGSSGGALLGYAFAHGHDLSVIEELAYKLYHGTIQGRLPRLDMRTVLDIARRATRRVRADEHLRPEMTAWVETIDELCPPAARGPARVPFYALVCNTQRRHPVALTDPSNMQEHCRDFIVGCDPREATGASMAVPFLVSPMRGCIEGFEQDSWFDGSVAEENPLMLPFTKWMRDRKQDPERTPKRLKLVLVNLNMRFSESRTLALMPPQVAMIAKRMTDLFDLLLDSKTTALVRTLRELEGVEIFTVTLQLGQMKFIARGALPSLIRSGQVIESWQFRFHTGMGETGLDGTFG